MKFSSAKLKALVERDERRSKDIAGEFGFSPGSLSHWALGRRVPGADELAALSRAFNVPLDHFFERTEMTLRETAPPYRISPSPQKKMIAKLRIQVKELESEFTEKIGQIKITLEELEK